MQGSSEAEPVLQTEEAAAFPAPPTGAVHLPHQLQWHSAGFAPCCPTMPAPRRVQSERESRDGQGERDITTAMCTHLTHGPHFRAQTQLKIQTFTHIDSAEPI